MGEWVCRTSLSVGEAAKFMNIQLKDAIYHIFQKFPADWIFPGIFKKVCQF